MPNIKYRLTERKALTATNDPALKEPSNGARNAQSTIKDAAWQIQAQMRAGFIPASTTAQETGQWLR